MTKVVCSSVVIELFGKTKLLIFKEESKDFKGECIELKEGCTSLLGGSCILQGGDQPIK